MTSSHSVASSKISNEYILPNIIHNVFVIDVIITSRPVLGKKALAVLMRSFTGLAVVSLLPGQRLAARSRSCTALIGLITAVFS